MMSISRVAQTISESVTLKLNARAAELRRNGNPVIHLGGGEPKSKAPDSAINSAVEILQTGEVRYTPADGTPALKNAIIQYTEQFYKRKMDKGNVLASCGAKQAIYIALQAVLNPGDEVIFPSPYWVSYPEMVMMIGGVPIAVKPADGSYHPSIADIEKHLNSKTKAVIINSPNNPTGIVYSEEFIAGIVELCEKRDLYLIMDDIYHRLIFDGRIPVSCYDYAHNIDDSSKLIVINGVSKQYAMTGFRIGWAVAAKPLIEVMATLQGHLSSCPSAAMQAAAVGAINGEQSSVDTLRVTLENNRNVLMDLLSDVKGVNVIRPDGTFYCYADFSTFDNDSTRLANYLIDKIQVITVPGCEFGWDGHLRISYCGSKEDIIAGMQRIAWLLNPNSTNELQVGGHTFIKN